MILDDAANAKLLERLRWLLLAVLLFGAMGLLAELALLEHWDEPMQRVPLTMLAVISLMAFVVALRPGPIVLTTFRLLMVVSILAGGLGTVLHYRSNAEFERELDPEKSGSAVFESALFGATPALAPGALIQLGLLGLVAVYRHPGRKSA